MSAALRWLMACVMGSTLLRRLIEAVLDIIRDIVVEKKEKPRPHAQ